MSRIAVLLALALGSCDAPPARRDREPARARIGWLRTADALIPLEDLFDESTRNREATAFQRRHDPSRLEANDALDARYEPREVEPDLLMGDVDF